jgi:hypothetical protein
MTEAEWLACEEPTPMLEFLQGKTSDRKLRLFAVACCSRIKHFLDENEAQAVAAAERFADGLVSTEELSSTLAALPQPSGRGQALSSQSAVWWACQLPRHAKLMAEPAKGTVNCVVLASALGNHRPGRGELSNLSTRNAIAAEQKSCCEVLREVVGNPFLPAGIVPSWQTQAGVVLARRAYESRDFTALPILGNALEDAGCTDRTILDHCRGPGPHVRGCWVVDLILGKE